VFSLNKIGEELTRKIVKDSTANKFSVIVILIKRSQRRLCDYAKVEKKIGEFSRINVYNSIYLTNLVR